MRLVRAAGACIAVAAAPALVHCGARTGFEDGSLGGGPATAEAGATSDGASAFDAPLADAGCTPAPPGGLAVASFPTTVVSIALTVVGDTLYAGTAAIGAASPLYTGALAGVPVTGGATQPLTAPGYSFGNVASDGARLYYPQTRGTPEGSGGSIYTVVGLAAIDLSTGGVHPIATPAPPWSTSSNLNSDMIAATTAFPGVFWIGGQAGSSSASTLSDWDARTDAATVLAQGQSLSGIAVDATGVYWADVGGSQGITVYALPLGGGTPSALAKVPGGTYGVLLGVTASDVVFVSDSATGTIEAVSKTGGGPRLLTTTTSSWANAFAWVDDPYLYWTESAAPTTLTRIPVAGGPSDVLPTQGEIQTLAFDACNVYVGSLGPSQVRARPK
ncbi:MAG TPA: hypothetical protein VGG39_11605 [Polyangiaceae bacterium]